MATSKKMYFAREQGEALSFLWDFFPPQALFFFERGRGDKGVHRTRHDKKSNTIYDRLKAERLRGLHAHKHVCVCVLPPTCHSSILALPAYTQYSAASICTQDVWLCFSVSFYSLGGRTNYAIPATLMTQEEEEEEEERKDPK